MITFEGIRQGVRALGLAGLPRGRDDRRGSPGHLAPAPDHPLRAAHVSAVRRRGIGRADPVGRVRPGRGAAVRPRYAGGGVAFITPWTLRFPFLSPTAGERDSRPDGKESCDG